MLFINLIYETTKSLYGMCERNNYRTHLKPSLAFINNISIYFSKVVSTTFKIFKK